jgi:hypothetical protein
MNHLKPHPVDKYKNSKLATGFYLAYESCVNSLTAAYNYAVNGGVVRSIQVTGHSLGGALAQNAYLDLACGTLGKALMVQDGRVTLSCTPISAPPVLIGAKAQRWLSFYADAAGVKHFYNPKDAVHGCDLVESGFHKKANTVVKVFSHPVNSPRHFGSQTALGCSVDFPDAHEPEMVWRGMNADQSDPKFWPVFDLDVTAGMPQVKELADMSLMRSLKSALANSCSLRSAAAQADLWHAVVKDEDRATEAGRGIRSVRSLRLPQDFDVLRDHDALVELQRTRTGMIQKYGKPSSHSASSSVYYTLLLGLSVRLLTAGALI